jgi:hypothetical protein
MSDFKNIISKSPWASSSKTDEEDKNAPIWQVPSSLFAAGSGSTVPSWSQRSAIPPPQARAATGSATPDWLDDALNVEARPMSLGRDPLTASQSGSSSRTRESAPVFTAVVSPAEEVTPPKTRVTPPLTRTGSSSSLEGFFKQSRGNTPSRVASLTRMQNAAPGYNKPRRSPSSSPRHNPPAHRTPIKKVESFIGTVSLSYSVDHLIMNRVSPPSTDSWAVVKINNIGFISSSAAIEERFPGSAAMNHNAPHYTQAIHVIMDRTTVLLSISYIV